MTPADIDKRGRRLRGARLVGVLAVGLVAALGSPATTAQTRAQHTSVQSPAVFDRYLDDIVSRYQLPGIAVGVVADGKVVYRGTRGELVVGSGRKIDSDTLFKIASNSKAMTGALLARLVDQKKLKWEDPVVKHLPDFRMYQDWVSREIQVRDLLIHNSGLGPGAGDLMLWPDPNLFTRADVIHGLRYLKPVYSFRSRYAYDNTLYIVAGEVAAAAGGAPFETLIRRELFAPLAMNRCQVGEWNRDAIGNVAQPHAQRDGRNVLTRADGEVIPNLPMMAAGGIRCSLDDMLTWTRAWLQPGATMVDGRPWLSQAQREEVWKAQMLMPLSRRMRDWDGSHYSAYGYGWRLTDVDGTRKVSHTGTLGGMYSALTLLPDKHVGFVVMINGDADQARTVLTQVLVKHFTSPDTRASVADYAQRLQRERQQETSAAKPLPDTSDRVAATATDLGANAGVYRDPWFGEVSVCPETERSAGAMVFRAAKSPKMVGDIKRSGQRLLVQWRQRDVDQEPWIAFVAASGNTQPRMTMARIDQDGDFSSDYQDLAFTRVRDCR